MLVIEVVMPDTADPHWAKTLDVMMLAITGGRERTLTEYDTSWREQDSSSSASRRP